VILQFEAQYFYHEQKQGLFGLLAKLIPGFQDATEKFDRKALKKSNGTI